MVDDFMDDFEPFDYTVGEDGLLKCTDCNSMMKWLEHRLMWRCDCRGLPLEDYEDKGHDENNITVVENQVCPHQYCENWNYKCDKHN